MLKALGRNAWRPAHLHVIIQSPGHPPLITEFFPDDDEYLDQDAVFGKRDSLVVPFAKHAAGTAPDGTVMDKPYYTTSYDFRLAPLPA